MEAFNVYRFYMAVKLHFTQDKYNVFENRGKVRGTRSAFYVRNDAYLFERLGNRHKSERDIVQYFVSNFAYGNENVVYSNEDSERNYVEWQRRKQSITKIFADDVDTIVRHIEENNIEKDSLFGLTNGQYPVIINLMLGGGITIETVCILNEYYNFVDNWSKDSLLSLVLKPELLRIKKLSGFVKYKQERINPIIENFTLERVI